MTSDLRERLLVMIGGGATVDRLAEAAGVTPRTIKRWLAEGRRDPGGELGGLAKAFDSAPEPVQLGAGVMTDEEFELHLAAAIRRRDVRAMKIYEDRRLKRDGGDEQSANPVDPLAELDELAAWRSRA